MPRAPGVAHPPVDAFRRQQDGRDDRDAEHHALNAGKHITELRVQDLADGYQEKGADDRTPNGADSAEQRDHQRLCRGEHAERGRRRHDQQDHRIEAADRAGNRPAQDDGEQLAAPGIDAGCLGRRLAQRPHRRVARVVRRQGHRPDHPARPAGQRNGADPAGRRCLGRRLAQRPHRRVARVVRRQGHRPDHPARPAGQRNGADPAGRRCLGRRLVLLDRDQRAPEAALLEHPGDDHR